MIVSVMPREQMYFHVAFTVDEAKQFKKLLDRSLNTLLPHEWPVWANELDQKLAAFIQGHTL